MPAAQFDVTVTDNRTLGGGYFVLEFESERATPLERVTPGQFVMLRGEWGRDLLNPRAFSILHAPDARHFSILAKVYGRGTALMARLRPGDRMCATAPLGVGFPAARGGCVQLLVAGGVGLPPLHLQARVAASEVGPASVELLYGGRSRDDLVLLEDFERWRVRAWLATEDGSVGARGFVTVALNDRLDRARARGETVALLACGPTPMLRAVRTIGLAREVPTFLCLEENMACGFGACLGCAVPVYGDRPYRYCCSDGPVFDAREVRWS